MIRKLKLFTVLLFGIFHLGAENGHQLWLRFNKTKTDTHYFSGLKADKNLFAVKEFQHDWTEITKISIPTVSTIENNTLVIGTLNLPI